MDLEDAWTSGGAHASLLNYLHGYTFEADPETKSIVGQRMADWRYCSYTNDIAEVWRLRREEQLLGCHSRE